VTDILNPKIGSEILTRAGLLPPPSSSFSYSSSARLEVTPPPLSAPPHTAQTWLAPTAAATGTELCSGRESYGDGDGAESEATEQRPGTGSGLASCVYSPLFQTNPHDLRRRLLSPPIGHRHRDRDRDRDQERDKEKGEEQEKDKGKDKEKEGQNEEEEEEEEEEECLIFRSSHSHLLSLLSPSCSLSSPLSGPWLPTESRTVRLSISVTLLSPLLPSPSLLSLCPPGHYGKIRESEIPVCSASEDIHSLILSVASSLFSSLLPSPLAALLTLLRKWG
jgi:hypothetical protein